MHMSRKPLASTALADWEHSKLTIQETGGWIKNADSKSTILAGSFGLSLTFAVPRMVEELPNVATAPFAFHLWVSVVVVFGIAALVTGYGIGNSLLARTSMGTSVMNRFSWPSLAGVAPGYLPPSTISADEIRNEAWEQAAALARIAAAKYRSFKIALVAFCVYLTALVAMTTIQAITNLIV